MSLDEWKIRSPSIPICIPRQKEKVTIGTRCNMYMVIVNSVSNDIIRGQLVNTPPETKHFKKWDDVVFHMDNILEITLRQ